MSYFERMPVDDPLNVLSILWWTPKISELKTDTAVNNLFTFPKHRLVLFEQCLSEVLTRYDKHKAALLTESNEHFVQLLVNQLGLWFNRLANFTSTVPIVIFMVAEFQRHCLDLRAYMDYMLLVKQKLSSIQQTSACVIPSCLPFLGVITYDVQVVEDFALTGVPVWYIQDLSQFSSKPFPGVSRTIFIGASASSKKLNTIYRYSREHFSRDKPEADDAPPWPAPPPDSRIICGPGSTSARPRISITQHNRLKFTPGNHSFWPPMLSAWRAGLHSVTVDPNRVVSVWVPGDNAYRFPDPHIFIPSDNRTQARVSSYYITWLNFWDSICLAQSSPHFKSLSPSQWRELLLLAFKEAGMKFKENSGAEACSNEMKKLLTDWAASNSVQLCTKNQTTAEVYGEKLTLESLPSRKTAPSRLSFVQSPPSQIDGEGEPKDKNKLYDQIAKDAELEKAVSDIPPEDILNDIPPHQTTSNPPSPTAIPVDNTDGDFSTAVTNRNQLTVASSEVTAQDLPVMTAPPIPQCPLPQPVTRSKDRSAI
ncbi:hypothetical protein EYR36_002039 [Pleurotus pulmonarius]|nr:hypothetical protein EYR36_002039 [Pleurotus pulmonarius]KAF4588221.1 hypothetical protein EYR38_010188 [Pleurotus pulmonarius]